MPEADTTHQKGVPGSSFEFYDCPAYYLRVASNDLPAEHLIDGFTHPAHIVEEFAFEIESGARNVESLSPKAIELVHLFFGERRARDIKVRELQKEQNEREAPRGRRR